MVYIKFREGMKVLSLLYQPTLRVMWSRAPMVAAPKLATTRVIQPCPSLFQSKVGMSSLQAGVRPVAYQYMYPALGAALAQVVGNVLLHLLTQRSALSYHQN